jgi:DNA-binding transcriptional LysR family regulator
MIENSTDEIISSSIQQNTIRINVLPSLSSKWLIPKLIEFNNLYPSIKAVIEIGDGPIDFIKNEADLYIRTSDNPDWHDVYVQKLMDENLIAVASPKLKIKNPKSLLVQVLLQHTSRPDMWNDYLRAIGFQNFQIEHSIGFQHFFMLIRAVLDGMGVALIPRTLIEDELQSGSLEQVITAEYENQFSYYILCKNIKIEQKFEKIFNSNKSNNNFCNF